jgi:YgiT-type zinc finger domain-containing protein
MSCTLCKHGETQPGSVTATLQRAETAVIVKQVPAEVCGNCGEYYLSRDVTAQVMEKADAGCSVG